jgi:Uma2 family endonuclease
MTLAIAKWTLQEYHRMIEAGVLDDRHVEFLNGEIVEMSPEGEPHAHFRGDAADHLRDLLRGSARIRQSAPITLPDHSEPEPDIAVVQDLGDEYLIHHPYPENIFWVIEYSKTSLSKDLEIKTKIYAGVGIREYWVVNLKEGKLMVFRDPVGGEYQSEQVLTQGNISPLAFPNGVVAVSQILR